MKRFVKVASIFTVLSLVWVTLSSVNPYRDSNLCLTPDEDVCYSCEAHIDSCLGATPWQDFKHNWLGLYRQ